MITVVEKEDFDKAIEQLMSYQRDFAQSLFDLDKRLRDLENKVVSMRIATSPMR